MNKAQILSITFPNEAESRNEAQRRSITLMHLLPLSAPLFVFFRALDDVRRKQKKPMYKLVQERSKFTSEI